VFALTTHNYFKTSSNMCC